MVSPVKIFGKPWRGFYIALIVLFLSFILYFSAPDTLQLFENRMLDWRMRLRGSITPPEQVKIITIDRTSRSKFGLDQEFRYQLADVLEQVCNQGAVAVGLDLFFDEGNPETYDPSRERLARVMEQCGNVVVGYRWSLDFEESRIAKAEAIGRRELLDATRDPDEEGFVPENLPFQVSIPDQQVLKAAVAAGYFTVITDPYGNARKIPSTMSFDGHRYYPFSLAIVRTFLQQGNFAISENGNKEILTGPGIEGVNVLPDSSGYLWLNYYGSDRCFHSLPFDDAVASGVPKGFANRSIVLFGVSGFESGDVFATTFDPDFAGVAIHATAVSNAISDGFLWRDYFVRIIELAMMVICALMMGVWIPRLTPSQAIVLGPLLTLAVWILAQRLLIHFSMWVHLTCPLLVLLLCHIAVLSLRIHQGEKAERLLEQQKKNS